MRKKERSRKLWERILTMILCISMVVSSTPASVFAGETDGIAVQDTGGAAEEMTAAAGASGNEAALDQGTQAQAEEPKPETQAPTEAPKPETQAPTEAPKPETQATTETPKPETQAPAEAPKPETQAPTEALKPETQAPTEAPKPETQAPAEAEKPETQAPAEAEKPQTQVPTEAEKPGTEVSTESSKPELQNPADGGQTELQPPADGNDVQASMQPEGDNGLQQPGGNGNTPGETSTESADLSTGHGDRTDNEPETEAPEITLRFQVLWDDNEDELGLRPRPDKFLYLWADGHKVDMDRYRVELVKVQEDLVTYEIAKLPSEKDGEAVVYTIEEKLPDAYDGILRTLKDDSKQDVADARLAFDADKEYEAKQRFENTLKREMEEESEAEKTETEETEAEAAQTEEPEKPESLESGADEDEETESGQASEVEPELSEEVWTAEELLALQAPGVEEPEYNQDTSGSANLQIIWQDQQVTEDKRALPGLKLSFTVSGEEPQEVLYSYDSENGIFVLKMTPDQLTMLRLPANTDQSGFASVTNQNSQNQSVRLQRLPGAVDGKEVTWKIALSPKNPDPERYILTEDGDTCILTEKKEFHAIVDIRAGKESNNGPDEVLKDKLRSALKCVYGTRTLTYEQLKSLYPELKMDFRPRGDGKYDVVVQGIPWCDPDTKNAMVYYLEVAPDEGTENGIAAGNLGEAGDLLVPSYNNAASPGFGSVTSKCHENGTLVLTRTGMTDYTATKRWLDEDSGNKEKRPGASWYLWRYSAREGGSYETSAPVTESGVQMKWDLSKEDVQVVSTEGKVPGGSLPKYDSDGYPYIYFAREDMEGGGYEQVFGSVSEDGTVCDTLPDNVVRAEHDKSIYNGGTISNRKVGTADISGRKTWITAHYQSQLSDVTVELTLERRLKNVENSDFAPTDTVVRLNEFKPEFMTMPITVKDEFPQYDALGREYEYRWIETGVYAGDEDQNRLTADGKTGRPVFVLPENEEENGRHISETAAGCEEHYEVEYTEDGDVINRLVGTTNYVVKKEWDEGLEQPDSVDVILKKIDTEGKIVSLTEATVRKADDWLLNIQDLQKYDDNGALYTYIAVEVPDPASRWTAIYEYDVDELNDGVNNVRIRNVWSGLGKEIRVRKVWLDGGDAASRLPVHLEVWRDSYTFIDGAGRECTVGSRLLQNLTLTAADEWWSYVNVTEYWHDDGTVNSDAEEGWDQDTCRKHFVGDAKYYVREVSLGDEREYERLDELSSRGKPLITTSADGYQYEILEEAPKQVNSSDEYITVTNRRVGTVDLSVTKNWIDGIDSETLKKERQDLGAEIALTFAVEGHGNTLENDDEKGYVVLTHEGETYKQPIYTDGEKLSAAPVSQKLTGESTQTVYFRNLPKYDLAGHVLHYSIEETVPEKLHDADYTISIEDTGYVVGSGVSHTSDVQSITVTNKKEKSGPVVFYKKWIDKANKDNGKRPDLYLTLYHLDSTTKDENGSYIPEKCDYADGKWSADDNIMDDWTCEFPNMPLYDENGQRIIYYAVEGILVDRELLDYIPEQYWYAEQSEGEEQQDGNASRNYSKYSTVHFDGERFSVSYETGQVNQTSLEDSGRVLTAADGRTVLRENGTFVNQICDVVSVKGQKVWENIPVGFPTNQLPGIGFTLMRKVKGTDEAPQQIAWTETDEGRILHFKDGLTFTFSFNYEGANTLTGDPYGASGEAVRLPKYDESGSLYEYSITETIQSVGEDDFIPSYRKDVNENNYTITNTYEPGNGTVTVTKAWGNVDDHYPEITYTLYSFYKYRTENAYTKPVPVRSMKLNWKEDETSVSFTGLPLYAPNDMEYIYYVKEESVDGYSQSVSDEGNQLTGELVTWSEGMPQAFTLVKTTDRKNAVSSGSAAVTFTNTYNQPDTVKLKGEKKWEDYNNAFHTRPENITLKLYRGAANQSSKGDNEIAEQEMGSFSAGSVQDDEVILASDSDVINQNGKVRLTWTRENATAGETWKYEITGLDKFAPNGSTWEYRIEEAVDEHDAYNEGKPGSVSKYAVGADGAVTMETLTNKLGMSAAVRKDWSFVGGSLNEQMQNHLMVKAKLQVREKSDSDQNIWQDAVAVFTEERVGKAAAEAIEEKSSVELTKSIKWSKTVSELPAGYYDEQNTWHSYEYRFAETWIGDTDFTDHGANLTIGADGKYQIENEEGISGFYGVFDISAETENGTTVIHNKLSSKVSITIAKTWEDFENTGGIREDICVQVQRKLEGQEDSSYKDIKDLAWSWDGTAVQKAGNLPEYAPDGTRYVYRVVEVDDENGSGGKVVNFEGSDIFMTSQGYGYVISYDPASTLNTGMSDNSDLAVQGGGVTENVQTGITSYTLGVKNSLDTVTVTVKKAWKKLTAEGLTEDPDPHDPVYLEVKPDGKSFPTPVYVELDGNAESGSSLQQYESAPWTATFAGLPKYRYSRDEANNTVTREEISYKVEEVSISSDGTTSSANADGYWKVESAVMNQSADDEKNAVVSNIKTEFMLDKVDNEAVDGINPPITDHNVTLGIYKKDGAEETKVAEWCRTITRENNTITGYTEEVTPVMSGGAQVIPTLEYTKAEIRNADSVHTSASVKGLPLGIYVLKEEQAPDGYEKAKDIIFTLGTDQDQSEKLTVSLASSSEAASEAALVSGDVTVQVDSANGEVTSVVNTCKLTLKDEKIRLCLRKVDSDGDDINQEALGYSEFTITGSFADGTDKKTNVISGEVEASGRLRMNDLDGLWIAGESYTFTETSAPKGYQISPVSVTIMIAEDGTIQSVSDDPVEGSKPATGVIDTSADLTNPTLIFRDEPIKISLEKVDKDGNPIGSARLNGKKFKLTGQFLNDDFSVGSKQETEITFAEGKFDLSEFDGKWLATTGTVEGTNQFTYTLEERTAPDGYKLSDSMPKLSFTVNQNGRAVTFGQSADAHYDGNNTAVIRVKNDPIVIKIKKTDGAGSLLGGARFTLERADDSQTDVWADNGPDTVIRNFESQAGVDWIEISGLLVAGKKYTLTETDPPSGYHLLNPASVTFTVNANGTITQEQNTEQEPDSNQEKKANQEPDNDQEQSDPNAITINGNAASITVVNKKNLLMLDKVDVAAPNSKLNDVELEIYTVDDGQKGEELISWIRDESGHETAEIATMDGYEIVADYSEDHRITFTGIPAGTYILHEAATPSGYLTAADVSFTVSNDGSVSVGEDAAGAVMLDVNDANIVTLAMKDAQIRGHVTVTKVLNSVQRLRGDTSVLPGTVFDLYKEGTEADIRIAAGITTGADGTWSSTSEETLINAETGEPLSRGLRSGTYYFIETKAHDTAKLPGNKEKLGEFEIPHVTNSTNSSKNDNTEQPDDLSFAIGNDRFRAELSLVKYDAVSGLALKDAAFSLFYKADASLAGEGEDVTSLLSNSGKTDADGRLAAVLDKKGIYTIRETENEGYDLTGNNAFSAQITVTDQDYLAGDASDSVRAARTISVKADDPHCTKLSGSWDEDGVTNARIPGTVTLTKADGTDGSLLADVGFVLYYKEHATDGWKAVANGRQYFTGKKYEGTEAQGVGIQAADFPDESEYAAKGKGTLQITQLPWGFYRMVETAPADGYTDQGADGTLTLEFEVKADDLAHILATDGTYIYNYKNKLRIRKVSSGQTEKKLSGAVFAILDEKTGAVAVDGITVDGERTLTGQLTGGRTYILHEKTAPAGYELAADIRFTMGFDGKLSLDETVSSDTAALEADRITITVKDEPIELQLRKTDENGNAVDPARGTAVFEVRPENGRSFADGSSDAITGITPDNSRKKLYAMLLPEVIYELEETQAPEGYEVAEVIRFMAGTDGSVRLVDEAGAPVSGGPAKVENSGLALITISDSEIAVKIEKKDQADKEGPVITNAERGPAEFTVSGVFAGDRMSSEIMVSSQDMTALDGKLVAGRDYTVSETRAPAGYLLTQPFVFRVDAKGSIAYVSDEEAAAFTIGSDVLTVYDRATEVSVLKTDSVTKNPLVGASLMLRDLSGTVLATWKSDGVPYTLRGILTGGETYELVEITAPEGYGLAQNILFTVPSDGQAVNVTMEDPPLPSDAEGMITVTKYTSYHSHPLEIEETYYTALFADAALTQRVSSVKAIPLQKAFAGSVTFDHLVDGTYYVAETDEFGNPLASDAYCSRIVTDGTCVLQAGSRTASSRIENAYLVLPPLGYYLGEGRIEITKHVSDGEQNLSLKDRTFYVRLFMDEEHNYPISDVQKLHFRDSDSATVAFEGLVDGTYYLAETDADGVPVVSGDKEFGYEIDMPQSVFVVNDVTLQYRISFTNVTEHIEEEEELPNETEAPAKSVKTGDMTPIWLYVLLLMASGAVSGGLLYRRRRRMKQN